MKKFLFYRFCYIICLAILLGTHSCDCNNTTTEQPASQVAPPPLVKGFWHTGTHRPDDILKNTTYPKATVQKEIYDWPWAIYRVKHDGSCGFHSFIPILLQDILVDNKWNGWLQDLYKTFYQPAQDIVQAFNLTDIDWAVDAVNKDNNPIKVHINLHIGSTTETNTLYQNTKALLQKLGSEATPRPLQEGEIQLLVDFLRKCVLMQLIKSYHQPYGTDVASFKQNLGKKLAELRTSLDSTTVTNTFWANEDIFRIFINLYAIMFDINPCHRYNNPSKVNTIRYYHPAGFWQDGFSSLGPDRLGRKKQFEKKEDLPQPNIMIYHHDDIFFEYIIPQELVTPSR